MRVRLTRTTAMMAAAMLFLTLAAAADGRKITNGPVDEATLYVDSISRATPVRVHAFSAHGADMGKPKHQDTAEAARQHVSGLLAVDLVEALRDAGFKDVALAEKGDSLPASATVVTGEFTKLDAGSQTQRVLWGFGAGKSKICVAGKVEDGEGKLLGKFQNCRKGLGWGGSEKELEGDAERSGNHLAALLARWADGDL